MYLIFMSMVPWRFWNLGQFNPRSGLSGLRAALQFFPAGCRRIWTEIVSRMDFHDHPIWVCLQNRAQSTCLSSYSRLKLGVQPIFMICFRWFQHLDSTMAQCWQILAYTNHFHKFPLVPLEPSTLRTCLLEAPADVLLGDAAPPTGGAGCQCLDVNISDLIKLTWKKYMSCLHWY